MGPQISVGQVWGRDCRATPRVHMGLPITSLSNQDKLGWVRPVWKGPQQPKEEVVRGQSVYTCQGPRYVWGGGEADTLVAICVNQEMY